MKTCLNLGTHPLHHPEEKDILPRAQGKQMPSIGYFISKILLLDETKQKKTKKTTLTLIIRGGFEGRPIITYRDWDAPNDDF